MNILKIAFLVIVALTMSNYASAQCVGDTDKDADVDGYDLQRLILDYGRADCGEAAACRGDLNKDNFVNEIDLLIFLDDFGKKDCLNTGFIVPILTILLQ